MDKYTLRQYRHLLAEIDELEKEKKHILDRYLAPPQPTGMPAAHNAADRIGNVVAMRDKYQQLIDTKLDELVALREQIEEAIVLLPAEDRRLMRLRYIQGKSWRRIAYEMHYSVDWVWHRHGEILRKIK
ncbi:MAG: hypothetical protein IJI40_10870 [Firmicutes bacterium]|nr:hypothetical protein [Bacillota bacterium]